MGSSTLNAALAVNDPSVGTEGWINTGNVSTNDSSYASVSATGTGDFVSNYLKVTNFGFSLPNSAVIGGIRAEIKRYASANDSSYVVDSNVKIVKSNGLLGSTNKADSNHWDIDANERYTPYGGYYDLWNESWTASDINNSNFGVALSTLTHLAGICLSPDTLISTPSGNKKISEIQKGDLVYSFNLSSNTKEIKAVTEIFSRSIENYDNQYFYIYTTNNKLVKATWNHDFYVDGVWKKAKDLRIGDALKDENFNDTKIIDINLVSNFSDNVWDITVEGTHNFYANGIIVHNASVDAFVNNVNLTVYYYTNSPSESPSESPSVSPSLSPSSSVSPSVSPSLSPSSSASASVSPSPSLATSYYSLNRNLFIGLGSNLSTTKSRLKMPTWGTLGRPSDPQEGEFGLNVDTNKLEVFDGSVWISFP